MIKQSIIQAAEGESMKNLKTRTTSKICSYTSLIFFRKITNNNGHTYLTSTLEHFHCGIWAKRYQHVHHLRKRSTIITTHRTAHDQTPTSWQYIGVCVFGDSCGRHRYAATTIQISCVIMAHILKNRTEQSNTPARVYHFRTCFTCVDSRGTRKLRDCSVWSTRNTVHRTHHGGLPTTKTRSVRRVCKTPKKLNL